MRVAISLERAKAQLRIVDEWTGDDALIEGYIAAASAYVHNLTGVDTAEEYTPEELQIAEMAVAAYVDYLYNQQEVMERTAIALCRNIQHYKTRRNG